ncbi:MAG: TetR/AcrR family transcriptional regulator [Chloroflexi bacterium]|nr:TetR/AcrR family transcriptional regulator [Chloroflexota bacterium]
MMARERIRACAGRLFAARGYDAVGVQEIVDAAGITKPTLYHYYGSKRGLLEALLAGDFEVLLDDVAQAACYEHDLVVTLQRVVRACFAHALEHPEFCRLQRTLFYAPPASEAFQAVRPWHARLTRRIEELFALAAADHGNMRGREQAYAATFLGMINTYTGLWLSDAFALGDDVIYRAVHQFMHGILS